MIIVIFAYTPTGGITLGTPIVCSTIFLHGCLAICWGSSNPDWKILIVLSLFHCYYFITFIVRIISATISGVVVCFPTNYTELLFLVLIIVITVVVGVILVRISRRILLLLELLLLPPPLYLDSALETLFSI